MKLLPVGESPPTGRDRLSIITQALIGRITYMVEYVCKKHENKAVVNKWQYFLSVVHTGGRKCYNFGTSCKRPWRLRSGGCKIFLIHKAPADNGMKFFGIYSDDGLQFAGGKLKLYLLWLSIQGHSNRYCAALLVFEGVFLNTNIEIEFT